MLLQQRAFGGHRACPARSKALPEPGRTSRRAYRRAAQAYMLISMPTDTSTIFGVVQLIKVLPSSAGTTLVPALKLGRPQTQRKVERPFVAGARMFPTPDSSLLDKAISLSDKVTHAADRCSAASIKIGRAYLGTRRQHRGGETPASFSKRTTRYHRFCSPPQQSLSAVLSAAFAPPACCAAVGSPCIWR